jgi:hypothetical protein
MLPEGSSCWMQRFIQLLWWFRYCGEDMNSCQTTHPIDTSRICWQAVKMTYLLEVNLKYIDMYLAPNTRLIHKTNNRLTLITVFCFRIDPPSLLWRLMKPNNCLYSSKFGKCLILYILYIEIKVHWPCSFVF